MMAFSANNSFTTSQIKTLISLGFPSLSKINQKHPPTHPFQLQRNTSSLIITRTNRVFFVSATENPSDWTAKTVVSIDGAELQRSSCLSSSSLSNRWEEFAKHVSGEWDGYGADFTREGKPIELPEYVVPEAFREWEVKVFDWQTQCPTLADPQDFLVKYKVIKLLPTVGCEADAATQYSVDERYIGGPCTKASAFAYQSSGSYVAVWQMKDHGTYRLQELEHCLVNPQNPESRVRISQEIRVENSKLVLQNIKVFCEQWYGPFRNGDQLGGCAIRDSAFASTDVLKSSEVVGIWQGLNAVAKFQNSQDNIIQELLDNGARKSVRDDECSLIFLPKQLWCSHKEGGNGESYFEVGWLLDHGRAITSTCIFSNNAKLQEIAIAFETADTTK